jgi:hypothetical protein
MRVLPLLMLLAACTEETGRSASALGGPDASAGCGTASYRGCCSGQTLRYCAGGQLLVQSCAPGTCGWDPGAGLYTCGVGDTADPSGKIPRPCPVDAGAVDGKPAATDAGPGDGAKKSDGGETLDASGCNGVPFVGCCSGATLAFCSGGQLLTLSCGSSATCGWRVSGGFYDCNTTGQPDPSGSHPRACAVPLRDGGLDAWVDRGHDLARKDGVVADQGPRLEAAATRDGPTNDTRADGRAADLRQRDVGAGLDLTGLDGYRGDAGGAPSPSGCGCVIAAEPSPTGLVALLLGACCAALARRPAVQRRRSR